MNTKDKKIAYSKIIIKLLIVLLHFHLSSFHHVQGPSRRKKSHNFVIQLEVKIKLIVIRLHWFPALYEHVSSMFVFEVQWILGPL